MAQKLVPEAKNGLSKFKTEVANEMGVPLQITMEILLQSNVVALVAKWLKEWQNNMNKALNKIK